jgi:hypothetical protein
MRRKIKKFIIGCLNRDVVYNRTGSPDCDGTACSIIVVIADLNCIGSRELL